MKKLLGYASLTLIVLLTACADNLDEIAEAGKGDVLSDRVPVELSISPSSNTTDMTRSPLATTTNGNFETPRGDSPSDYVYMGVFALAQTNTPAGGNTSAVATGDIKWDADYARALWNQPTMATIVGESTTLQFVDPSTLNTTPKVISRYYPLNSWYNYYFYSYYPRVDDANVHVSNNNVVTADYTLNGSQDIITGVAKPADNDPNRENGYCGKYFRDIRESGNGSLSSSDIPQMALTHHLAQLRFYVRPKDTPVVGTFQVKDITLLDVPRDWSLTIADKSNDNNRGTMTSRSATTTDMPVRKMDDSAFAPITLTSSTPQLAGYAMIPTTDMINAANQNQNRSFSTTIDVQLTIVLSTGEEVSYTRTITPNTAFEASHAYNIIIKLDQYSIEGFDDDPNAVDLGLPSGTKWAKMNVGATEETDLGETGEEYFAWGETTGHSTDTYDGYHFSWENAPYYDPASPGGDYRYWLKYPPGTVLEVSDDIVAISKEGWRMPTAADIQELINNTNHQWVSNYINSGVNGMLFINKENAEKFIFMPAAGYRFTSGSGNKMRDRISSQSSNNGYYWSSSVSTSDNKNATSLRFSSGSVSRTETNRCNGLLIRGVLPKKAQN